MSREWCFAELTQEQAAKKGDLRMIALKIEDLKEITKDPDVLNIIALREFIKEHNTIGYFNYQQTRKEESNGE